MPISLSGSLNLSGSLTTTGTITATTLVVQTITSSISSITGSTNFGTLSSNTHTFTGSMYVTGAFYVTTGSVGIGTTTPSSIFQVVSTQSLAVIRSTTTTNYAEVQIENTTNYLQVGVEGATGNRMGGTIAYNSYLGSYANYGMTFHTNNLNRMTITSSGSVGIGTSSPLSRLDLGVGTGGVSLTIQDGHTKHITSGYVVGSQYYYGADIYGQIVASSTGFNFNVYNSANFIFNSGNLYIKKSDGFQNIIIQPTTTTAAAGTRFLSAGNDMYLFIDNSGGDYGPTGANGASFAYNANIRVVSNRALQIATNDTVRMTITSGGNVGIGTTSPDSALQVSTSTAAAVSKFTNTYNSSGTFCLVTQLGSNANNASSYHYIATTGGGDKCYVLGNGNLQNTNNSYGQLSDIRLKKEITQATPKLEKLLKVNIVNFKFINDEVETKQIGVIAQELEEIFPSLVEESTDRETNELRKSVKYSVFVPILIKAIQELTARVQYLENK